ncbi:TPA: hypothetical protein ACSEXO_003662 [Proteus mirabilis]
MIELSSKLKNIIFWVSTASISLIVFGVFVIDIFVTDAHGKDKLSIIFSYLSTIFAFLSSLALFATIGVYFWQKNDILKKQIDFDQRVIPSLTENINAINSNISKLIVIFQNIHDYEVYMENDSFVYTTISKKSYINLNSPFPSKQVIELNKINRNQVINKSIMQVSPYLYNLIQEIAKYERELSSELYLYTSMKEIKLYNIGIMRYLKEGKEKNIIDELIKLKTKVSELKILIS